MLRKFVVSLACAGAVIAPAIAEEPARTDADGMLLTASQMDGITAGGFSALLADASLNATDDSVLIELSGEAKRSSTATASTTLNVTYNFSPEGEYLGAEFESDYEGEVTADTQQAFVNQPVDPGEPVVPGEDPPAEPPPPPLSPAEQFARDNTVDSIYSVDSVNQLIAAALAQVRNRAQSR